jgi:hypothetical protein
MTMAKMIWTFDMELVNPELDWANQKIWLVYEKPPLLVRLRLRKKVGFSSMINSI